MQDSWLCRRVPIIELDDEMIVRSRRIEVISDIILRIASWDISSILPLYWHQYSLVSREEGLLECNALKKNDAAGKQE